MHYRNKVYLLVFIIQAWLLAGNAAYSQTCDPGADGITPVGGGPQQLANGDVCANAAVTPAMMKILYTNVDDGGDPNNVEFFIDWDDGTTQTLRYALGEIAQLAIPANSYEATVTHFYPTNGGAIQCEYVPTTFLQFNGTACPGSVASPPAFVRWNTDDQLTGQHLVAEQVTGNNIYEVCAGESVTVRFSDQSTFNCVPPAYLNLVNDRTRWTQFIYGTTNTITSGTGVEISGSVEAYPFNGAVDSQVTPVNAPFAVSLNITVPADALVGKEFEITMNSWNFCNKFTDGDLPILTTGIIRIIDSPAAPTVPATDFCVGQDPTISAFGGGGTFTWYTDLVQTNVAHVGNPFDPTSDPAPVDRLSNLVPGTKTYYVTETLGVNNCEGPATPVVFTIIENPTTSVAGADFSVCAATSQLNANNPAVGTGIWTSSGPGIADTPSDRQSTVSGLVSGTTTTFTWTITNGGICVDASSVAITRDLEPSPADAGPNISLCTGTSVNMNAVVPSPGTAIGTWTVTAGPGNVVAGEENLPTATIENLVAGANTTLQWEVNNGTCIPPAIAANISSVQIINFLDPPSNAGVDIFVCDPMTTSVLAADDPVLTAAGATGLWTVLAGPGNVVSGEETLFNANVENLALGSPTTFTWTVTNGVCLDVDDVIVTIEGAPTVSTATTPSPTVCSSISTVTGEVPLSGTGLWSVTAGSANIVAGEEGFVIANVENMVPGELNTFTWTISTVSCAVSSSSVDITNIGSTTSTAGPNQNVCVATATLSANAAGAGETGLWSVTAGPGSIDVPNNPNSTVSSLLSGTTTTFMWTIDNGVCPVSTSTVNITRDLPPSISVAGPNQSVCTSTATLAANMPAVGTGAWSSSGPGTVDDPVNPLSGVSNLAAGTTTTFTWTISNGTCADNLSTVQITRDTEPTISVAGADQNVCAATATLTANPAGFLETGAWTSLGFGVADFPNNENSTVSGLVQGTTTTFTWTITNGGSCLASASSVDIIYDDSPTISNAGLNQDVCSSTGSLAANDPVVGSGFWTSSGPGIVDDPGNRNSIISNLVQGTTTTFTWTITNGTCPVSVSTVDVIFNEFPTTANAGTDQIICGTSTNLVGNDVSLGIGAGFWDFALGGNTDGNGIIANPLQFNSAFTGTEAVIYNLEWTASNGACTPSVDGVTIEFAPAIPAITISGDLAICVGNITTYTIPGGDPASYNYNWDISGLPASTVVIAGSGTPFQFISLQFADPAIAGLLSVEVEDKVSFCIGSPETINITVYETPIMSLTSSDPDLIICENDLVIFTATDALGIADNFEFKLNGITVQSGPSSTFITGALPTINSLTVTGTAPGGICPAVSAPPIIHTINPLPGVLNVSGGGSYCSGGTGVSVGLDGSEVDVTYELFLDGNPTGIVQTPGGGAFDFPAQTTAGIYTVNAATLNNCEQAMAGNTVITIDPLPLVFNIIGGGDICQGGTGLSIGLDNSESGINYQLYRDGLPQGTSVPGTGLALDFGLQAIAGSYDIIATNPTTFCSESMLGSAVINELPLPDLILTNNNPDICTSENTNIDLSSSVVGTTFTWTVTVSDPSLTGTSDELTSQPIGTVISQALTNSSTVPQTATYTIIPVGPTPTSCLGNAETVDVVVNPQPDGTISVDNAVICSGESVLLTFDLLVGTSPFEIVYNNGVSDTTVSNIGNTHIIAHNNLTVSTTYTLISIQDINGCIENIADQSVIVNVEKPIADFTADVTTDCTPLVVTFTNNDIQAGTQYTWVFGDGSPEEVTSNATVSHTFNNSTVSDISFNVMLMAQSTNGSVVCSQTTTEFITINAGVNLSITPSTTEGCSPVSVSFENSSQGVLTNKWFWREQGTTDENDITDIPFASFVLNNTSTLTQIYEVVYQGDRNGCGDEIVTEVIVHPELAAGFTVSPGNNIQLTDPTITVDNITPGKTSWNHTWTWGDGQSTNNVDPGSHTYAAFGQYELKLVITDMAGNCTSEKIEIITVEPILPEVDFSVDITEGCRALTVTFTNLSISVDPDTYLWEFTNDKGTLLGTSNLENLSFTFFTAGRINVSLSGSNPLGVTDTETKLALIEVLELPIASFTVTPETVFLPDQLLFTRNLSAFADAYEWDFGDGRGGSGEFEPQYRYESVGVYDVSLIAIRTISESLECRDTLEIEKVVKVIEAGTATIPNSFFPGSGFGGNSGGSGGTGPANTVFLPRIKGVRDDGFNMQVYDRWGHLLFESTNKTVGWNGRDPSGKLYPVGVYVYKLELVYVSGQQTSVVGDVTLIR